VVWFFRIFPEKPGRGVRCLATLCVEQTDALLGDAVDRVVAWYDAVAAVLIA
jgi:hypothetical protein